MNVRTLSKLLSWLAAAKLVEVFSAFIVGSIIVRNLNTNDYGLFTYWISITAVASMLASLGLDKYELNRFRKENVLHFHGIFSLRLFTSLFLFICVLILGFVLGELKYAGPASFIILVKIFDHYRNRLLAINRSNDMYRIDVMKMLIGSTLRFIIICLIPKVEILLLTYLVEVVYLFIVFSKNLKQSIKSVRTNLKSIILKIWPLAISTILLGLYTKLDIFIIDLFYNKEILGNYGALLRIIDILFIATFSLLQLIWSYIITDFNYNRIKLFFRISIVFALILTSIICFSDNIIVKILYGNSFNFNSILFLAILARLPIMIFLTVTGDILLFEGKFKTIPIRLVISISLFCVAVPFLRNLNLINPASISITYSVALFLGGLIPFFFDKNFKSILKLL